MGRRGGPRGWTRDEVVRWELFRGRVVRRLNDGRARDRPGFKAHNCLPRNAVPPGTGPCERDTERCTYAHSGEEMAYFRGFTDCRYGARCTKEPCDFRHENEPTPVQEVEMGGGVGVRDEVRRREREEEERERGGAGPRKSRFSPRGDEFLSFASRAPPGSREQEREREREKDWDRTQRIKGVWVADDARVEMVHGKRGNSFVERGDRDRDRDRDPRRHASRHDDEMDLKMKRGRAMLQGFGNGGRHGALERSLSVDRPQDMYGDRPDANRGASRERSCSADTRASPSSPPDDHRMSGGRDGGVGAVKRGPEPACLPLPDRRSSMPRGHGYGHSHDRRGPEEGEGRDDSVRPLGGGRSSGFPRPQAEDGLRKRPRVAGETVDAALGMSPYSKVGQSSPPRAMSLSETPPSHLPRSLKTSCIERGNHIIDNPDVGVGVHAVWCMVCECCVSGWRNAPCHSLGKKHKENMAIHKKLVGDCSKDCRDILNANDPQRSDGRGTQLSIDNMVDAGRRHAQTAEPSTLGKGDVLSSPLTPEQDAWLDEPMTMEDWMEYERMAYAKGPASALAFKTLRDTLLDTAGVTDGDLKHLTSAHSRVHLSCDAQIGDLTLDSVNVPRPESAASKEESAALTRVQDMLRLSVDPFANCPDDEGEYEELHKIHGRLHAHDGSISLRTSRTGESVCSFSSRLREACLHPRSTLRDPLWNRLVPTELSEMVDSQLAEMNHSMAMHPLEPDGGSDMTY